MTGLWTRTFRIVLPLVGLYGGIVFAGDKADIKYGRASGESLLLDAHVPDGDGPFPVVIMVHGGGWSSGDKGKDITGILEALTEARSFTWFSINYRLAPTNHWPACYEDVQTAVRWVKAHAAEYKGDPKRIALMGYSAGGQLACLAAMRAREDTKVQAVVCFAAPTDLVADTERRGGLSKSLQMLFGCERLDDSTRALLREMSPINYVKQGFLPFLFIQGDADKTVPYEQTLNFVSKFQCELITIAGAPHRLTDWDECTSNYKHKLIMWLRNRLNVPTIILFADVPAKAADSAAIKPDITVAADGSGDFKTVQEAVNSIPRDNRQRMIIEIKDGVYHEKVRIDPNFITLRGQNRATTRIEFAQGMDEFTNKPDDIGRAVININGSDFVMQDLSVENTQGVIGPHAFAVYGHGDRTVLLHCQVLSRGADTLALWGDRSRSYQARLNIRGSVDFVCPRGWCYMTDCVFYEVNPAAHASIWHDGSQDKNMKFVLRHCRFEGVDNWILARHHHDAQFYLLDCTFSKEMCDRESYRVVYPIAGEPARESDAKRNHDLDASNRWGAHAYYYNCHRDCGDYIWFTNNLASAPGSPTPDQVTAAWTFGGKWDPERGSAPIIQKVVPHDGGIAIVFSENVTVKGKPQLLMKSGESADYSGGSGSTTLEFASSAGSSNSVARMELRSGSIFATEAGVTLRKADLALP